MQLLFAHVGLPNLFTFCWLSGDKGWHSALQASDLYYQKQGIGHQLQSGGVNEVCAVSFLVLKAYLKLIQFDLYLARGNFAVLYDKVRNYPVGKTTPAPDALGCICSAVDMACIWYWKEALCLQRSAATACLLKNGGIFAQMVIGAQHLPFKAHTWVEVDGRVVNDKPYVPEIYAVLDRC